MRKTIRASALLLTLALSLAPLAGGDRVSSGAHRLAVRRLHLDDVRAEVGEDLRGQRAGDERGEVHHAESREEAGARGGAGARGWGRAV